MKHLKDTPAYRYASAVMEGKPTFEINGKKYNSLVGKYVRLAVERFFKDLERTDMYLDWEAGYKPILFMERIVKHWSGALQGKPFLLEPHQHFHWMNQWGWYIDKDKRRFNRVYKQVARGNGKTAECSGQGLWHIASQEKGRQVWVGATKEQQAAITVNDSAMLAMESPALKKIFTAFGKEAIKSSVVNTSTSSFIRALGRDSKRQDGLRPSFGIVDEFHEHQDTGTINVLDSALIKHPNPMMMVITTAGFNKNYPCYAETRKGVVDLLEGRLDSDRVFGLIYEMDDDDDLENPDMWIKANPNWGVSVYADQMMGNYKIAKMEGYSKLNNFYTKNLNMWMDAPETWIDAETWKKNTHGLKEHYFHGLDAFGGCDLAKNTDFTAFTLLIPRGDIFALKVMFWLPANYVKNRKDGNDFSNWVHEGWIKIAGEEAMDYEVMIMDIVEECKKYNVKSIGFDQHLTTHTNLKLLDSMGIDLVAVSQRTSVITLPTSRFEELAIKGRFEHFNNPVLNWQLGNVVLSVDSYGNNRVDKKKSERKIDGIAATIDALAVYTEWERNNDEGEILFGLV